MRLLIAAIEHYHNISDDHVSAIAMTIIEELSAKAQEKATVHKDKIAPELNIYVGLLLQTLCMCLYRFPAQAILCLETTEKTG
jgi:hypothetical protein